MKVQTATRATAARLKVRQAINERRRHAAYWQALYVESHRDDAERRSRSGALTERRLNRTVANRIHSQIGESARGAVSAWLSESQAGL